MLAPAFQSGAAAGLHLAQALCASGPVQSLVSRAAGAAALSSFAAVASPHAATAAAVVPDPWYLIKQEERLAPPVAPGDEAPINLGAFSSHHPSQRFANVLSKLRATYPAGVWSGIGRMYPARRPGTAAPLAVDIAVGAEGRGGVELASRLGFRVIGVEADPTLLARTFEFAQAHDAHIELITAKVEHSLLGDACADLVTFLHGLHLVDTPAALRETWRMLKPGGRLFAAWNDRDLSSPFMRELEDVLERHVAGYTRAQKQRGVDDWGERLQEGGLFRLVEYSVHQNPVHMPSPAALMDVLDCMSFVRAALHGDARKRFNADVRALLERRCGRRAFLLPLETKMYAMEKIEEGQRVHTRGKKNGNGRYHHAASDRAGGLRRAAMNGAGF